MIILSKVILLLFAFCTYTVILLKLYTGKTNTVQLIVTGLLFLSILAMDVNSGQFDLNMFFLPVIIVIGSYIQTIITRPKIRYFLRNGIADIATVISIDKTILSVSYTSSENADNYKKHPIMDVILEIKDENDVKKQLKTEQVFINNRIPEAGDEVYVLTDPNDPNKVMVSADQSGKIVDYRANGGNLSETFTVFWKIFFITISV